MKYEIKIQDITLTELDGLVNYLNTVTPYSSMYDEPIPVPCAKPKFDANLQENAALCMQQYGRAERVSGETPDPTSESVNITDVIDAEGLHWDERIHSSNKKMKADGTWIRRKGLAEQTYQTVKAELLGKNHKELPGLNAATVIPVAPQAFDFNQGFVAPTEPVMVPVAVVPQSVVPAPYAPPYVAPQPVQATVAPAITAPQAPINLDALYQTVFEQIRSGFEQGKVTAENFPSLITEVNTTFGLQLTGLQDVKGNEQALVYINSKLTALGL